MTHSRGFTPSSAHPPLPGTPIHRHTRMHLCNTHQLQLHAPPDVSFQPWSSNSRQEFLDALPPNRGFRGSPQPAETATRGRQRDRPRTCSANLTRTSLGSASASEDPHVSAASHAGTAHSPAGRLAARHRTPASRRARCRGASAGCVGRFGAGRRDAGSSREERARAGPRRAQASGRAGRAGPFVSEQTLPPPLTRGGRGRQVR